jgi:hypothetical protein
MAKKAATGMAKANKFVSMMQSGMGDIKKYPAASKDDKKKKKGMKGKKKNKKGMK